jgi:hypothetical protein
MPALTVSAREGETRGSIAAILEILKSLDLKGCIVAANVEAVRAAGARYALKLNGGDAPLLNCAIRAFSQADAGTGQAPW